MANLSDLTPREIDILRLVLAGQTNKAIATIFAISEKTVEFHLNKVYTKIGMRTRMLAGMWALQQGIQATETREIPS
jgi:two-component system nitrate/nitrite response regulator NarL